MGKRITVAALGTRGDVQPVLALCLGLKAAGHAVLVVAGSNFVSWIESFGLRAAPSVDIEAVMNTQRGLAWSESSQNQYKQLQMMQSLFDENAEAMFAPLLAAAPETDLYLSGFTSEPLVQTVSAKTGVPYVNAHLQPQLSTRSGAATLLPIVPRGESVLNRWVGTITDRLLWSVSAKSTNRLRAGLGLPPLDAGGYARARQGITTLYGFSPAVVPPAPDWPAPVTVTGYWFLDDDPAWQPPDDLARFLEAGSPPVYIGFGSMSNSAPEKTLALILEAVQAAGQRASIGAGWGALGTAHAGADLPPNVLITGSMPHGWLFPRLAGVVHHGGAGTTAAGLRAGQPALIVPHMSDQPFWARRLHELGVGLKPIPRHQLTAGKLAAGLRQLAGDAGLKARAAALAEVIHAERGVERAVAVIESVLRS